MVVGHLVKITKQQNLFLQRRVQRISLIEEMSKELLMMPPVEQLVDGFTQNSGDLRNILPLLRTTVLDDISHILIKYIAKVTDAPAFVLFSRKDGGLQVWARSRPDMDLSPHEIAIAEWTYGHEEMAGAGTQTLADVQVFFMPMKTQDETVGVIGIVDSYKELLIDQRGIPERHFQPVIAGSDALDTCIMLIRLRFGWVLFAADKTTLRDRAPCNFLHRT